MLIVGKSFLPITRPPKRKKKKSDSRHLKPPNNSFLEAVVSSGFPEVAKRFFGYYEEFVALLEKYPKSRPDPRLEN
jgi:hypothetical protein